MLRRIWPITLQQSPLDVFALLLLGHGFAPDEFASTARAAWTRLLRRAPLNKLVHGYEERHAVATLFEDGPGPDLGITQTGSRLALGANADQRLRAYLQTRSVEALGRSFSAADTWPQGGGGGRNGNLVAVLCKGAAPGELYELVTADTPVVAVTVAGEFWELPIARAVCQLLAGLADEYELPGPEFERAPEAFADWPAPNVLFVTSEQRDRLAAGADAATVIPALTDRLPVGRWETVRFHPHQGADPNPPVPPANGRVQLVEGGNGYRFNALRTDFDCLMRRRPNDPSLPIQADVWLCKTCRAAVDTSITSATHLPKGRRVLLHNQRLLFDDVRWPSVEKISSFPFRRELTHGPPDPIWSCTVDVSAQDGLEITGLKLANRPDDPFAAATDVMSLIEFKDVEVDLGDGRTVSLPASAAFAAQRVPSPTLEIAFDGGPRKEFRVGIKLTASFLVDDTIVVEAAYSLVLKHSANDIDPGGAALACKLYPQLALRHMRAPVLPDPPPDEIPDVTALRGTVSVWCNNTVPASMRDELMQVDEHLGDMATGRNAATLLTDSNLGALDGTYESPGLVPAHVRVGQSKQEWKAGRKLAGVQLSTEDETVAGTVYRLARRGWAPTLPHWSWLFDYSVPTFSGTTVFVGSYAQHEQTEGGFPAAEIRDNQPFGTRWPTPDRQTTVRDHRLTVRKLPRQGAYDNVHVALDMGKDAQGRQIVSAPFCADKCLHLHWRWGIVAVTGPGVFHAFHGWGDGSRDGGAHTVPGTPLIPPNQRLDLRVVKESDSLTGIDYKVTAHRPGSGHAQVFLEQGISFAFGYSGLGLHNVGLLASALGLLPFSPTGLGVRRLFHRAYPVMRWFGEGEDVKGNLVQQVPGPPTSTDPLPFLERL
jgi:hypothetical protein